MPRTDWSDLTEHLAKVPTETEMLEMWKEDPEVFVKDILDLVKAVYREAYSDALFDVTKQVDELDTAMLEM